MKIPEPLSSLLNKMSSLESKLMSRKLFYMRYKSDLFHTGGPRTPGAPGAPDGPFSP